MPASTPRGALPYPLGADPPDTDGDIRLLAQRLAAVGALYLQGTASARPAAGVDGRFFLATDTGVVSYDTGSAWIDLLTSAAASAAYQSLGVRAWRSGSLSVPHATLTVVPLNSESFDDDGFHDNATNPSRLIVPAGKGGLYRIAGQCFYNAGAGPIGANLRLNGATFLAEALAYGQASSGMSVPVDTVERLAAGDYVEMTAYQTVGGTLSLAGADRSTTFLTLTRIGA